MELIPQFNLRQTVYFIRDNKIRKSTVTGINYPDVWLNTKGKEEQTSFSYRVKSLTTKEYGNTGGVPSSLLFKTKKDLIKTL